MSTVSSSQPLQLIIPVGTLPAKSSVQCTLAMLDANNKTTSIQSVNIQAFTPQSVDTIQNYNMGGNQIFGNNYTVSSSGKTAGLAQTTYFNLEHSTTSVTQSAPTDVFSANGAGAYGASFVYVAKWNFYSAGILAVAPSAQIGTLAQGTGCLTTAYAYTPDTEFPNRYVLFCPLQGQILRDNSSSISVSK